MKLSKQHLGLLITVFTALTYGVWPSAMRAAYADGANASFVILFATLLRSLPLFLTCLLQKQPLFRTSLDRRQAFTGGFFQAISSSSALAAVIFLPGPLAVVIMFTHTLMLLAYMIWRDEIKADLSTIAATIAALVGLVFVLDLFSKQTSGNFIGMGLAFLAAIAVASRLYVMGHQTKTRNPAAVGAENFLVANLFMPLLLFWQMPQTPHSQNGYLWMLLGIVSLGFGTLGQFYAVSLIGSFRYSLFMKMEPLFATIFAAVLISEYLKPLQYFGIFLVIGSLVLYQIINTRRTKNAAPVEEDLA
jgi:drug/metabolite transporter (DMT)-like permease